jgi:aspartate-semialdehyde dehydrogenase
MVGQQFVKFWQDHPWFKLTWVGASDRSAEKKYREATSWRLEGAMPEAIADREVNDYKPGNAPRLVFSAADASVHGN